MAAVTGSDDLVDRSLAASATSAVTERPFRREWSWSGAVIPRWRIWTMAFTRACRAERLATTRTRMASTGPSLVLPAPEARPLMAARAASTASSGSDLPWLRRDCRLGRLTSTTSTPLRRRNRAEPHPIGAGALDADLGHLAEALEPGQQRLVASGVGIERLGADEPTQRVECGSDVFVEVGVDTTRDPGSSFYDGHGHPFLP